MLQLTDETNAMKATVSFHAFIIIAYHVYHNWQTTTKNLESYYKWN